MGEPKKCYPYPYSYHESSYPKHIFVYKILSMPGADPGFQVRGAHLNKLRRAEGGAKIFGVFRVKNHDFTTKKSCFSIAEGSAKIFEVFRVKNHDFTTKNHIFFPILGGARAPPPLNALIFNMRQTTCLKDEVLKFQ